MNGIKLILCILLFGLASCDVSRTLLVNGERSCTFQNKCGTIEVSAYTFPDRITFKLDGNFKLCPDSAKISRMGSRLERQEYRVYLFDSVNRTKRECPSTISIDGREEVWIEITRVPSLNYAPYGVYYDLLPSGLILCNDVSLISDSVRFVKCKRKWNKGDGSNKLTK